MFKKFYYIEAYVKDETWRCNYWAYSKAGALVEFYNDNDNDTSIVVKEVRKI